MRQTRLMSAVEVATSTAVGLAISTTIGVVWAAPYLLDWQAGGGDIDDATAWAIVSAVYTVASILRSYALRRVFERLR